MTKNQLLPNKYGVLCKVSHRKALCGETFCFLEKRLLSIFLCFEWANVLLWASDWLRINFLGMYGYFPLVIFIGQLCLSGPSYSSRTLSDVNNTIILNCDVHPPLVSVHFSKEMTRSKISQFNLFPVKGLNLTSTKGDQHFSWQYQYIIKKKGPEN